VFANYTPIESRPDENTWIGKDKHYWTDCRAPRQRLGSYACLHQTREARRYSGRSSKHELARTVEETGDFKDDDEMGAYAMLLYISLAYAIHYGVLILVKD